MTHKLLLADDSVTIQRVVELTFSGEDVQVVTVGDGEQAIARIPVELPDIVLADIGMPKRSGYDVAAFVKGRPDLAHIPVLLLAGAFEPVDEQRAQQVQSDGVLVKPFEPQQVIARVRELIQSAKPEPHRAAAAAVQRPEPVERPEPTSWREESRTASAEPRAQSQEPRLGDYFDRLDAAFAELAIDPGRRAAPASTDYDGNGGHELPTVERLLSTPPPSNPPRQSALHAGERPAPVELTEYEPAMERVPAGAGGSVEHAEPSTGRNLVADMFAALFAVEQGETAAPAPLPSPRAEIHGVTDGLVDEVTRRVLERLAPDTASELVTQIVSEVAERLIREEIARIKAAAGSRL